MNRIVSSRLPLFNHYLLIFELQPGLKIREQLPLLRDTALLEEIFRVSLEIDIIGLFPYFILRLVDAEHRPLEVFIALNLFFKFLFDAELVHIDMIHSASIRYTDDDKWWIFRGKIPGHVNPKTKEKGPGREQYIDHARTLIKRPFYKKEGHCFGDAEINKVASEGNERPGNPRKWLEIGINHHLTLVARQIASLA